MLLCSFLGVKLISLKYAKEYRTDVVTDASGRKKEKYTYVGPLYDYSVEKPVHTRQKMILAVVGIISTVLYVLGLYFPSNLSRILYVSLPFAANAIVIFLFFGSLLKFFPYKESLTREEKEKGGERIRSLEVISTGLFFLSDIGAVVALFSSVETVNSYDYVMLICGVGLFVMSLTGLLTIKNITYKEKPNPERD